MNGILRPLLTPNPTTIVPQVVWHWQQLDFVGVWILGTAWEAEWRKLCAVREQPKRPGCEGISYLLGISLENGGKNEDED